MEATNMLESPGAICAPRPTTSRLSAKFDDLSEGGVSPIGTLTTGGITFSCLHFYSPHGNFMNPVFAVEQVDDATAKAMGSSFSPRCYLTFGGNDPGPGGALGRFGSMRIAAAHLGTSASLDVFTENPSENTLRLEALFDGRVVASDAAAMRAFPEAAPGSVYRRRTFTISGVVFDALRLVASGPKNDGAVFIGVDNVTLGTNDEPNPWPSA
jgi:hypothetical protein